MDNQGLGDDVLDAEAGVEGGERVLKNNLQVAAEASHFAATGGEKVAAVESHAPGRGLDQAKNQAAQSTLAGARFPDEPKRLTGLNFERNVVDRPHFVARVPAKG